MNKALINARVAIEKVIKQFGSPCKLEKTDGTSATTTGVILSGEAAAATAAPNSFINVIGKTCYVPGKISAVPQPGDVMTFKPNMYVIKTVQALSVGEGKLNVFAYRLELST